MDEIELSFACTFEEIQKELDLATLSLTQVFVELGIEFWLNHVIILRTAHKDNPDKVRCIPGLDYVGFILLSEHVSHMKRRNN